MLFILNIIKWYKELFALFAARDVVRMSTSATVLCRGYLRFTKRPIYFRKGTSDLLCLKQVFLNEDYSVPYPVSKGAIIDGGSNIGSATLYFKAKYPGSLVISVEPDPSNFALLRQNCGDLDGVVLIEGALWPAKTRLSFEDSGAEKYAMAVVDTPTGSGSVEGFSIDEIINRHGVDRISLLKLDIEGAERELFSSGATTWLDRVDIIAVELHDRFRRGCAMALYSALQGRDFVQEVKGDTIFIQLRPN